MPTRATSKATKASSAAAGAVVDEWRTLLDRHAKVSCALEKTLQNEHGIGLSEFEILDRLVDATDASADSSTDQGSYRMSDLTSDIYLSQSALSRAVARLESDGLVHRSMCTDDRRAIFVCLTDAGRKVHAEAKPTHREVLGETWE
ncbi:MarR family transcriptional regulator [Nocardioides immobilis]|uniref:MarR family transcriptional regulator n=1 Tax=Nocardioides immobilis TaxID=2049295 RepID=A0A417Y1M2_9ACTN|nr:MarR family transcriptional regulator [Nocardioides immobilis]RHW26457.1 MarR family transcriptional regulator [Nocardioides immobilis]